MGAAFFPIGAVAASIYKGTPWDPLADLAGLVYFLHPDDATDIISGEINSFADRVVPLTFTAPAAGTRMARDFDSERPDHVATGTAGASNDHLRAGITAEIAVLNGTPAFSFTWLGRKTGSANTAVAGFTNTTSFITGNDRIQISISDAAVSFLSVPAGGGGVTWSVNHGVDSTQWHAYTITYDGAGEMELFIDGASIGTDTDVHTATSNLRYIYYSAGQGWMSVQALCTGVLSAGDIADFHAWLTDPVNA